mmetsp:Transcript_30499/g.87088  ORF Transcript_30499/g.87088 Transcript_30499/m.87088 type:complete len:202 (+) Transcript_30499:310-915(+)
MMAARSLAASTSASVSPGTPRSCRAAAINGSGIAGSAGGLQGDRDAPAASHQDPAKDSGGDAGARSEASVVLQVSEPASVSVVSSIGGAARPTKRAVLAKIFPGVYRALSWHPSLIKPSLSLSSPASGEISPLGSVLSKELPDIVALLGIALRRFVVVLNPSVPKIWLQPDAGVVDNAEGGACSPNMPNAPNAAAAAAKVE